MNAPSNFDIQKVRQDFPILQETVYGKPLVYFDNGATTQKPQSVIDAISNYYETYNSNVHRGVHYLSQKATDAEESARKTIQQFIHAAHNYEVIFTKGTTDGINLVAYSFGKAFVQPGDEIIISAMEHHANIVPWQVMCEERGATLKVIPFDANGVLDMEVYKRLLTPKTKMVAVTWVSNTLGTTNPVAEIIALAHQAGAKVMLDAAQAIQHMPVDVQALDVDFLVFSGHKIYGPTGIGVLYGKETLLREMPPYQTGGSMIKTVTLTKTTYGDLPHRFEAGTPHISGIIGLGAAIQYVNAIGVAAIEAYEHELLDYAEAQLQQIEGVRFIGNAPNKSGAISLMVDGLHPFDLGELLDKMGIAVRTGHHCCQPIMDQFEIPGTLRMSFAMYNTKEEVDAFVAGLKRAMALLV